MRILVTDIELFAAALVQARVTVRAVDGSIADYGGAIEKYTPNAVRIDGTYYMREVYLFEIKEN
ncbi:hypothetical protein MKX41_02215 [Paenibacillus sp. FSL R5-0475]|uniref:hypothetical protein n=1 Tax=Paenibacillus sp. FSL R5-0475 TaxID=2921643 RepID=UPI0030FC729D